jgi:TatD DNase family protein
MPTLDSKPNLSRASAPTRLPLADSHVHLDDGSFDIDRAAVIERARMLGVDMLVVPGIDAASWPRIRMLCAHHAGVYPAYGLHPLFLARHRPEHLAALPDWVGDGTAVAVGEIGLDYFVPGLDPADQRHYFTEQLALARELDLPVIVHARRAVEEVILTLRRMPGLRGVVHSFAGSEQQAQRLWEMGFHLGMGGPVTYERAKRLRRLVASMPLDRLLLETDAPDQPDAAHRGQRNEPARVVDVLHCVAELRGEPAAAIAAATTANARRLFGLDRAR